MKSSSDELQRLCQHIGLMNMDEAFALSDGDENADLEMSAEWFRELARERGFWIRAAWKMRGLNCSQHQGFAFHIKNEALKRNCSPPYKFGEFHKREDA